KRGQPMQCVIEKMFVVNRIELAVFDHIESISELENGDAGWLQKARKAGNEIVNVVDMRNHIVRYYDIGEPAFARQPPGASRPEEIVDSPHPDSICLPYRPVRRIDAKAVDPAIDEITQQISVIAGDLNYETGGAKIILADQRRDMIGRMLEERR